MREYINIKNIDDVKVGMFAEVIHPRDFPSAILKDIHENNNRFKIIGIDGSTIVLESNYNEKKTYYELNLHNIRYWRTGVSNLKIFKEENIIGIDLDKLFEL